MRVAVTGVSGLIGRSLVPYLKAQGHDVLRLVRRVATSADEVTWDPEDGYVDVTALAGVQGVIHLAAVGIGDRRWTPEHKDAIRDSRLIGTRALASALAGMEQPPEVLVSGSAIGYYGNTGDATVDEAAPAGTGFLADVVVGWEKAAQPARDAGIRVVHARSGIVVTGHGGAFGRLWPLFQLGLGGRLGSGRQWWSWISIRDEVAALAFLLTHLEGPVNLTAPNPATNAEITRAMGSLLRRPTLLSVPGIAIDIVLGELSSEVTGSIRAVPTHLLEAGFEFRDPTIADALAYALATR